MKRLIVFVIALAAAAPCLAQQQAELPLVRSADGKAVMRAQPVQCVNGLGNEVSCGGSGSGAAATDATVANPGSDASRATAVQGVTGGKPLSVSGPLTDAQLRASAVPMSQASQPLPTGATTELTLSAMSAKLPASLGAKPAAGSASFVPATDATFQARGGASIQTGQVSIGSTATLISAARSGRQKIGVTVTTAVQCAFGNAGVTLATGWPLAAVAYASDSWDTGAALYGVCASTATVGFREQF